MGMNVTPFGIPLELPTLSPLRINAVFDRDEPYLEYQVVFTGSAREKLIVSMKPANQLVEDLVSEWLAMEPRVRRLYFEDLSFRNALTITVQTLTAVAESGSADGWAEQDLTVCIRGALSRLLRDDLLALEQERQVCLKKLAGGS